MSNNTATSMTTIDPNESRMTSATLVVGMQAGDQDAWIRMTCLFGPLVYKWINNIAQKRGCRLQRNDVSDISQEVFLVATTKIEKYRHSKEKHGTFRGWLYGITRKNVLKFIEMDVKTPPPIENIETRQPWNPQSLIDEYHGDGEVWKFKIGHTHEAVEIVRAKSKLRTWQAFWRTVINGEETVDVAEDLNMTPKAVRQARHRIIQSLREEIERLDAEDDE